jgi:hypothetical protein
MKNIIYLSVLVSYSAWPNSIKEFNQALNQDLKTEIRKDEDKFKKNFSRTPASVPDTEKSKLEEPTKIDKNVRQIGPNEW